MYTIDFSIFTYILTRKDTRNLPSEIMFTKFAQRHGISITIGCCHYSDWGNYVDWKVDLGDSLTLDDRPRSLDVRSDIYQLYSFPSGVQGCIDRQNVIRRLRKSLS